MTPKTRATLKLDADGGGGYALEDNGEAKEPHGYAVGTKPQAPTGLARQSKPSEGREASRGRYAHLDRLGELAEDSQPHFRPATSTDVPGPHFSIETVIPHRPTLPVHCSGCNITPGVTTLPRKEW